MIGGYDGDVTNPDPAPNGLLLFDMNTLAWKDSYDADAGDYTRAKTISDWYSKGYGHSLSCCPGVLSC